MIIIVLHNCTESLQCLDSSRSRKIFHDGQTLCLHPLAPTLTSIRMQCNAQSKGTIYNYIWAYTEERPPWSRAQTGKISVCMETVTVSVADLMLCIKYFILWLSQKSEVSVWFPGSTSMPYRPILSHVEHCHGVIQAPVKIKYKSDFTLTTQLQLQATNDNELPDRSVVRTWVSAAPTDANKSWVITWWKTWDSQARDTYSSRPMLRISSMNCCCNHTVNLAYSSASLI